MKKQSELVNDLFNLRFQLDVHSTLRKTDLLKEIKPERLRSKKTIALFYDTVLFLLAYPENKTVRLLAESALQGLQTYIQANENTGRILYSSGVPGSKVCADFGFEIVKWLRQTYQHKVSLHSFAAPDAQITSILSAVMPQVESEILQDENSTWKDWMKQFTPPGGDLLDSLITLFDQSSLAPEVKDELWTSLGLYVELQSEDTRLPAILTQPYYHRKLTNKAALPDDSGHFKKINISKEQADKIIASARMVLVNQLREIDPISFCNWQGVSYYQLPRGISIAIFSMRAERRHPIDSYSGYMVFKNGCPYGYAGSWVLFDSARIGLNIFPSFRGGESQYIFSQILNLHKQVFHLNRFTVDPYQIGKHNTDGIKSGVFWLYYKMGFRPIRSEQKLLAESEQKKRESIKGYRSSAAVLSKLADSRMELIVGKRVPVLFDATDMSLLFAAIVKSKYDGNRQVALKDSYKTLTGMLGLTVFDKELRYVIANWSVLLLANEGALRKDAALKNELTEILIAKTAFKEQDYIRAVQGSKRFRNFITETYTRYL